MNDPLGTYVEDHLAGATYAIDLLEALRDQHQEEPLGHFAARLLTEVKADHEILTDFAKRIGAGGGGIKAASAWVVEKVSRLKLRKQAADSLGTFETLEFLALGIQGKLALWHALTVAGGGPRLGELDLDRLIRRAETQHSEVEKQRLNAARSLFSRGSAWANP